MWWPFKKRKLKPLVIRGPVPNDFDKPISPIVIKGKVVDIQVEGFQNFTDEEKDFYLRALNLMLNAISSGFFKSELMTIKVSETNGLSRLEAYDKVISGFDAYHRVVDNSLQFFFTLYYERSRTIGYTNVGGFGISTNRYFVSRWMTEPYGVCDLAGHLFHEYLHSVGFYHRWRHKGSLVYEWGYLARDVAKQIMDGKVVALADGLKDGAFVMA
ncbi:bone morphogenetic protein 1 [Caudoviricetes sp.]|nr:bone morphogenetic protein 1 [Caudoviricetes sp.]